MPTIETQQLAELQRLADLWECSQQVNIDDIYPIAALRELKQIDERQLSIKAWDRVCNAISYLQCSDEGK